MSVTRSSWKKKLYQRVPIFYWIKTYSSESAVCDLIAGITVGLTVMPQSLAYATLAGLEPQYGLYSAFVGCLIYVIFGSCKDITIGPTALMSLMTYQQVVGRNPDFVILLSFLTGVVLMFMGTLRLGVLMDFISVPVTVGFTSATSLIIAVSQVKGLLGLKFESSGQFLDTLKQIILTIHKTKCSDMFLGLTCIVILILLRTLKNINMKPGNDGVLSSHQRTLKKGFWLVSTARNAIVVIICSLFAYMLTDTDGKSVVNLTGHVRSGLPEVRLPPFSTTVNGVRLSFYDMCLMLGSSIVLVPVIAVLGNVAIAKAFASGDSVDATQELYTLGLCNMLGSFFSAMPVTGSFSRSAVNHASGVRTPIGGLYTGVLILLALRLLTPFFYYIPKSSLAAVIICAVIFMIEYEVIKPMWKSSRKDLIPTFTTFVSCLLLNVEIGIVIGVLTNIIMLLMSSARPFLQYEKRTVDSGYEYLFITLGNNLYFPAVDFLRSRIIKIGLQNENAGLPVIIDCSNIVEADYTVAKGMEGLIQDFKERDQPLYFYNSNPHVIKVFKYLNVEGFNQISSLDEIQNLISNSSSKKELHSISTISEMECDKSEKQAEERLLNNQKA